jgi:WD40 repeat protein/uncharacterized caspase-like protein
MISAIKTGVLAFGIGFIPFGVLSQEVKSKPDKVFSAIHTDNVNAIDFGPKGKYAVTGGDDSVVKKWDATNGHQIWSMGNHSNWIESIAYGPEGNGIASGSYDETVKIRDAATGNLSHSFNKVGNYNHDLAFTSNGKTVAICIPGSGVKTLNLNSEQVQQTFTDIKGEVNGLALSGNDQFLATSTNKGFVKVWDLRSGEVVTEFDAGIAVKAIDYHPQDQVVATGDADGNIKSWDANSGTKLKTFEKHLDPVKELVYSNNGYYIASCSGSSVQVWSPGDRNTILNHYNDANANDLSFSPNNNRLAAAMDGGAVKIWKLDIEPSIMVSIRQKVNGIIKKWKANKEFRKLKAYNSNKDSITKELTERVVNKVAEKEFKAEKAQADYEEDYRSYADYVVFKIKFPSFRPIYKKVPLARGESKKFAQNFDRLRYRDFDFGLQEEQFFIKEVTIKNPVNSHVYRYDYHTKPEKFRKTNLTMPDEVKTVEKTGNALDKPEKPKEPKRETFQANGPETVSKNSRDSRDFHKSVNLATNLPYFDNNHANDVAVVIGNRDYEYVKNVDYAINSAELMYRYLVEALGYKESHVFKVKNATLSDFNTYFGSDGEHRQSRVYEFYDVNETEVFVYYAGHGASTRQTEKTYLVPTEGKTTRLPNTGYTLSTLKKNLLKSSKHYTIVLDACLSGSKIMDQVSAMGYTPPEELTGSFYNRTVFTSSAGKEYSTWYGAKGHTLYTWFFLKAIKEYEKTDKNGDGKVTAQEIHDYVAKEDGGVPEYAEKLNNIDQHPQLKGKKQKVLFRYD